MEILAAFPTTPEEDRATDQYQSLVSSLRKFREWLQGGKQPGVGGKTVLKSKLKNVELFEGFPNLNIAKAYLEPIVDQNAEKFSWGMPDNESLIEFAKAKLGWTRLKTEEILAPVMNRLNEKKQATIKDYFKTQTSKKHYDSGKMSKRVQKAVGKMGGEEQEETIKEKPKKERKRKAPVKKTEKNEIKEAKTAAADDIDDDVVLVLSDEDSNTPPEKKPSPAASSKPANLKAGTSKYVDNDAYLFKSKTQHRKRKVKELEPSTSTAANDDDSPIKKRTPRIPNTKQVIPQREKDNEEQQKTKQKAIEIFKKAQKKK